MLQLQPVIEVPSAELPAKEPWERQEGEPARWFMRFRIFLSLGSKRTVNAARDTEYKDKQKESRTKTGPEWYNAAKRWQWATRADAWDNTQRDTKAAMMRQIAKTCAFVSRPFRLTQLNSLADALVRHLERGQDPATFLAMTRQLQALMHQIILEVEAWDITIDASCDAFALDAYKEKRLRMQALKADRTHEEEVEFTYQLAQLQKQQAKHPATPIYDPKVQAMLDFMNGLK